jgi:CDP-paratose 2-epimerase
MSILITGGAGFVGSSLAVYLRQALPGATVVCMDNLYRRGSECTLLRLREHGVAFHWGDIRDPAAFPPGPVETLLECSAEPSVLAGEDGRLDYLFHTNLVGAFNWLEKARQWNSNFLFLSTSRVYPISRLQAHPWREELTRFSWENAGTPGITSRGVHECLDMHGACALYGYTKYAVELLIEEYRCQWGLKAVVNRCGVIAGPWQFGRVDQGVLSLWVLAHHYGSALQYIGYGGAGKQVRDFLHVDDLCELITEQMRDFDRWDSWVGNVAGGLEHSASLLELTVLCREITGRTVPIASQPISRSNDLRIFVADCTRLFQRTAWRPRRDVRQIVADTAAWIGEHELLLGNLAPTLFASG